MPKMVMNSFGNRNFMQSMEGSACIQSALFFFYFKVLGWGVGEDFFHFPLFPTCSFQIPNGFPSGSQYVP
jgi:hypothetical protein